MIKEGFLQVCVFFYFLMSLTRSSNVYLIDEAVVFFSSNNSLLFLKVFSAKLSFGIISIAIQNARVIRDTRRYCNIVNLIFLHALDLDSQQICSS